MADNKDKIPNDAHLLRRIHPTQIVLGHNGRRRLSSAPFRHQKMSVDVEQILVAAGQSWHFSLRNHPEYSLVRLGADVVRALNQIIEHVPQPDNDAHAEVIGKKTGAIANAFRDAAEWVKKPDDAD